MRRLVLYLVMPQILILFVAELMVLGGMNQIDAEGYPDRFAPYEAMMPGQGVMASWELPCDFQIITRFGKALVCEAHPIEGPFVSVFSTVYNDRFVQTIFSGNDLYVGDLVRRWGRPDVIVKGNQSFYMVWDDQGLYGFLDPVGPIGRFSYMLPIEYLAIGLERDLYP